ncbi:putative heterokaryon incompatibility [Septoria linicola]|nr:putative heterokaryon incompatibility [Septoria linicola]
MRLLSTTPGPDNRLNLIEAWDDRIPKYAILSHTWSEDASEEVLFRDIENGKPSQKAAYQKVVGALQQAREDGHHYIWIDTCCIDKSSSAELSEAINSMYAYYGAAEICYVFLADIAELQQDLTASRWWERGWTLQELLAPAKLVFFTNRWTSIGSRDALSQLIHETTGIEQRCLVDADRIVVHDASIARRMSWAARRRTSRSEDIAYCLLGLFNVNMPLLYGEGGTKAFLRLQEEIMQASDDHTLFAWDDPLCSDVLHGLLADRPAAFADSGNYEPYQDFEERKPYLMTNRGLQIELCLYRMYSHTWVAALSCPPTAGTSHGFLAITLKRVPGTAVQRMARYGGLIEVHKRGRPEPLYIPQAISKATGITIRPSIFFRLRELSARFSLDYAQYDTELQGTDSYDFPDPVWRESTKHRTVYLMNTESRALTAILAFKKLAYLPPNGSNGVAVLLGSSSSSEISVGAVDWQQYQHQDFQTLRAEVKRGPPGSWIELESHRVHISVETTFEASRTIYDVKVEILEVVRPRKNNSDSEPGVGKRSSALSRIFSK